MKTKFNVWGNEIEFKKLTDDFRCLKRSRSMQEWTLLAWMKHSSVRLVMTLISTFRPPWVLVLIDAIFSEYCEHLIQPTFITDYPVEMSLLTKRHRKDPTYWEFELFVNGKEVANAYSELNDPIDQLDRFHDQMKLQKGRFTRHVHWFGFVRALEHGMPPHQD